MVRVRRVGSVAAVLAAAVLSTPSGVRAQTGGAPVIERVEPTSGPPGTIVHVVGRRLGDGTGILLGSQPLEVIDALPNRVSARIPAGAKSGHIVVSSAAGTVRSVEFAVTAPLPAPKIRRIEPRKGPPGTTVVIEGRHFSPRLTGNVVTFAGRPVIVSAATPIELRVIVPEVEVENSAFVVRVDQAGEAQSAPFQVTAATRIARVEPLRAGPGAQLTLRGRGFSKVPARNRVYLNTAKLAVERASETELVVRLPSRIASGKLLVDVQGAGRAYSDAEFVVQRPPTVTGFAPTGGPPGTAVVVRGTNLGAHPAVVEAKLGEVPLTVQEARDTRLTLLIPEGAASGRLSIRVHGVGPAWSEVPFEVSQALTIARFAPQSGPAGTVVVLEGRGFGDTPGKNRVTIGGRIAPVLAASPTRLEVRVPEAPSGPIHVQVQGAEARTAAPFVVTVPPRVTSISPLQGPVGTQLRIEGRGFGRNPQVLKVLLGGHPLAVEAVRDDVAVVRVTAGAKSGRLEVAVPLQGTYVAAHEFEVLPEPAIASAEPEPPPSR